MNSPVSVDVVRVFTAPDGRFGNELGIVASSQRTTGREQALAAALGFSETVFVDRVDAGVATMRIFSPRVELPFAGHPSVGTAWWLHHRGTPVTTLRVPAGDVPVRVDGDLTWIRGRAEWTSVFQWRVLDSVEALDALEPAGFTGAHLYPYTWTDEPAGRLRSRMFSPAFGIVEDQATGAAAIRLSHELDRDLAITQGRGSQLFTHRLADDWVEVGGRTALDRTMER